MINGATKEFFVLFYAFRNTSDNGDAMHRQHTCNTHAQHTKDFRGEGGERVEVKALYYLGVDREQWDSIHQAASLLSEIVNRFSRHGVAF